MGNINEIDPISWLNDQFEYENCDNCGKGVDEHTACVFLGNWFARCNNPPAGDGA